MSETQTRRPLLGRRRWSPLLALFVLGLGPAAGCSSGSGELSERELRTVVLQPADLPQAFVRFDYGPIGRLEAAAGERADAERFGRKSGWKVRYRRPGSIETPGPLVVVSTLDLFDSDGGAEQELEAYRRELDRQGALLPAPEVGDEAVAMRLHQGQGRATVVFLTLAWRHGAATASVSLNGFQGKISLGDATALARTQDRRIAGAARD